MNISSVYRTNYNQVAYLNAHIWTGPICKARILKEASKPDFNMTLLYKLLSMHVTLAHALSGRANNADSCKKASYFKSKALSLVEPSFAVASNSTFI